MYGKCECFVMHIVVSCVHHAEFLNAAFRMNCSLLIREEDARGDHMKEAYYRAGLMAAF